MQILRLLEDSFVVSAFEVLDFKSWPSGSYLKLKAIFIDKTILHAREYTDENERHYSFHWQDEHGQMICRWDNACHHQQLKTYPHHKHRGDSVEESYEIALQDVLRFIEKAFSRLSSTSRDGISQ